MADIIKLLLQAEVGKDSINGIKTQLESLEKNIKPIKIDIEIDKNALQQIQNLNKTLSQSGLGNINATSSALTKNISGVVKGLNAVAITSTKTWKDAAGEMTKYAATTKTLGKTITENFDKDLKLTGSIETDNSMAESIKAQNRAKADSIRLEKDWTTAIKMRMNEHHAIALKANKSIDSERNKAIEDAIRLEKDHTLAIKMRANEHHTAALKINTNMDKEQQKIKNLTEQIELYQQKMRGNMDIFADKNKGKFDEVQLDNLRQKMEGLSISSGNASREMKEVTIEMGHMQKAAGGSNSMLSMITENLLKFARFYIVGQAVVEVVRAAREGVKSIKELDTSLTELSKVSDLSASQLKNFTDQAYEAGRTIGRTGKEVIDATAEFKRAGYEINEAFELSQQALLLTNIGDGMDDVKESSSSLIAILKGFKMEAQDTAHVVDALNEVSNNYAVDTNNLTEILKRTSGTIGQTGTSYEELLGLATGGFESLRNAEMVASGINMISQRLRGNQIIKYYAPYVQKCA